MYNKLIKSKIEDLQRVTNTVLKEGFNLIEEVITKNKCELTLSYKIIIPSQQKEQSLYGFLDLESYELEGRGFKKYGEIIYQEFLERFRGIELTVSPITYNSDKDFIHILSGYESAYNQANEHIALATYVSIENITFKAVEQANYTDYRLEAMEFVESTCADLKQYATYSKNYGNKLREARILYNGKLYQFNGNLKDENHHSHYLLNNPMISYNHDKNEYYLLTENLDVYEAFSTYESVDTVDAMYDYHLVIRNSLYSLVNIYNNLHSVDTNLIYYKHKFYKIDKRANVIMETQKPEPFMNTNIESETMITGSGQYSTILIDDKKHVIVPITSSYISMGHDSKFTMVVINHQIYSLVGEVSEIGFIKSHYGSVLKLKVAVQPEYQSITFIESPTVLLKYLEDTNGKHNFEIEIFDTDFKNKSTKFELHQRVRVTKEINSVSEIKGLEGEIISISSNRKAVTVQFFHHFNETFDVQSLEVI